MRAVPCELPLTWPGSNRSRTSTGTSRRLNAHAAAAPKAGFPTVEIWPTDGLPAVYAEWPSGDADAPTVLVYGHHDVQPVDPLQLWHTDPFDPTIDGDLL